MDEVTNMILKLKPMVPTSSAKFSYQAENFDHLCPEGTKKFHGMRSPTFIVGADIGKESEWYVFLEGDNEQLRCFLHLDVSNDNNILPIPCAWRIGFGNSVNPFCHTEKFDYTFTKKLGWGGDFIKISDLYDRKRTLLQNNSLQICVQITLYGESSTQGIPKILEDPGTGTKLLSDFDELFQSELFSDVEVKCEEETFHCHKVILSARSDVFRTMFTQQMTESNSNKVTIEDMKSPVMRTLLKYIYTGRVDPPDDSVKLTEVIYGAEKYQLKELKNFCFNKMFELVSEENVGELIEASQMYNANEEVKKVIRNYCKEIPDRLARLLEDPGFRQVLFKYEEAFFDRV